VSLFLGISSSILIVVSVSVAVFIPVSIFAPFYLVPSHLLSTPNSPGWTHTGLTGASSFSKPPGAWTAEETVLYMLDKVRAGDFYILCPDNETRRELDQLRIMWSADDIVQGRPALSRWHKDYKALFEEFIANGLAGL